MRQAAAAVLGMRSRLSWPTPRLARAELASLLLIGLIGLVLLIATGGPRLWLAGEVGPLLSVPGSALLRLPNGPRAAVSPPAAPTENLHLLPPDQLQGVDCNACHALPRSVAGRGDVVASTRETCLSCHTRQQTQLDEASVHPPFKSGECTSCHRAHPEPEPATTQPALLSQPASSLCLTCHPNTAQSSRPFSHPPYASGQCSSCHNPHASSYAPTLRAESGELCLSCHQQTAQALAAKFQHPPFQQGTCTSCHTAHNSSEPAQLIAPMRELCLSCHAGPLARMDEFHRPVRDGRCSSCHEPHGSKFATLKRLDGPALCLTCHRRFGQ